MAAVAVGRGEPKVVSAVRAEHDSVSHLLESRYASAAIEVFEALRERASRSIEDADVIEREDLAGFAAPLDSYLRVHDKLGNSIACYSGLEGLAARVRKYCGPGLCHGDGSIQHFPTAFAYHSPRTKGEIPTMSASFSSDCLPDVRLQLLVNVGLIGECPRSVRESDAN